jgi:uncharacterized SAM-binding protein YcdF (DUF218 family)
MMLFVSDPVEWLLPTPIFLVIGFVSAAVVVRARRRQGAGRRWLPIFVALAIWSWIFTTPALANFLMRWMEGEPLRSGAQSAILRDELSLVVVLASGELWSMQGGSAVRLDEHGWERLYAGVRLWRRTGGTLLFAGGPGTGPEDSLGFEMRRVALQMGVPENSMRVASGSGTTREDLAMAADEIRRHPAGQVWLVTSAIHMARSRAVASRLGLAMRPYACDFRQLGELTWRGWLPNSGGPKMFAEVLHELLGRLWYRMRGWAD